MNSAQQQPPLLASRSNTKKISLFLIAGIGMLIGYYATITMMPPVRHLPFFQERMSVGGVVFSPTTAFLRMARQNNTNRPITTLHIDSDDYIRTLPETLGDLTHLTVLTIRDQPMTALPDSIGNLTNLNTLIIINTPITALPDSIGNLTQLEDLEIIGTNITTVPPSITNLYKLKALVLSNNRLQSAPNGLTFLDNLIELSITNNKIRHIPYPLPASIRFLFLGGNRIPYETVKRMDNEHLVGGVHY